MGRKNTQEALVCKLALIDFQFAILVYTFEHLHVLVMERIMLICINVV